MLRRLKVPLSLLLIAAGCQYPVGPDVDPGEIQIDFSVTAFSKDRSIIDVDVAAGSIVVEGNLTTNQGGYELRPALERLRRGVYRFSVEAASAGPGITIPIQHHYRAVLHPWPSGRYRLEVVVRDVDARWELRVFDDEVRVQ